MFRVKELTVFWYGWQRKTAASLSSAEELKAEKIWLFALQPNKF